MGKRKRDRGDNSSSMPEQEIREKVKFLKNRADLCQRLHDAVKRIRGKSGHPKCEFLYRLPSRRSNPDYYKVISRPISLVDIEQKLKTSQYDDVSSFVDDMELMFNNAKTFYEPGTQENTDAEQLQAEFSGELRCIVNEEDETCSPESKRLKLRISHGKVITSNTEDCRGKQQQSSEHVEEEVAKGEGLIVQIKLQDTPTLSIHHNEPWKPKREKQRKDYAELFGQRKKFSEEEKQKMIEIYDLLLTEKDEDDLLMSEPFMVRPSVKKYPHYYVVIKRPIDLQEIKEKIDNDRYTSIERFMADVNTLFRNAKFFNEESSTIYEYADHLHKISKAKYQQLINPASLCPPATSTTPSPAPPTNEPAPTTNDTPINPNVGAIFDEIKTYTNPDDRALWETFKGLPNKLINNDYYTMIKQPIDMITIATKLLAREYPDVEKIVSDFVLLFDNACRYYKPNTDQYKDAVTLHKVLIQKREQLIPNQPPCPNVPKLVQGILRNLVKAVMQYKDPVSGRKLSDNIWATVPSPEDKEECHENDDNASVVSATDLVTIEKRTIKGLYRRLDLLQDDVMSLLKHVQSASTPENQVYQDALKLQQVFLQERDRLCHNGKLLWSPAFYQYSLEQLKQQQAEEAGTLIVSAVLEADNQQNVESDDSLTEDSRDHLESTEFAGTSYSIGDTVYISPKKIGSYLPHIVAIEKLWVDKNGGDHWFKGSWFYRPEETFHVSTRRFIVNEVFCTNRHQMVRLSRVVGKCCVLQYKDYCRNTVEGFDDEDTFVCRDRYHIQMKSFKPLKNWGVIGKHWELVPREQPINLDYVYSKFASSELIAKLEGRRGNQLETAAITEGIDTSEVKESEGNEMDDMDIPSLGDVEEFHMEYDNIVSKDQTGIDVGCCSYDQYCLDHYCFRLGDYVYLRSDEQQSYIARIEKMWTDQNGDPWFHGCWFLRPSETMHLPTHMFYPNELLMSNIADTNPMRSVIGKCAVLTFKDFCTWRPTEIDEKDVYLCEERYNEHDKDFKKLKGLKKFPVSSEVVADEIYYFQKEIIPYKRASPHLFPVPSETEIPELADDIVDPVVENASSVNVESSNYDVNDQQPSVGVQPITLFALDLQSQLRSRGSEVTLANVVQAAKNEWSKLSAEQQAEYQLRSSELSSLLPSVAIVPSNANQPINKPPSVAVTATPTYIRSSYVCYWDGCGMQFPDVAGLCAHVTNLGAGSHIKKEGVSNYYCEWRNCHRHKRCGGKPFNTQAKMLRHLKEVHMGRAIKEKMSSSGPTPQWQSNDFSSSPATPAEPVTPHPKLSTVLPAVPLVPAASTPTLTMGTTPVTTANTVTTNSIKILPSVNAHQQQQQQKSTASSVDSSKQTSQLFHTTVYTRYIEGLRQNKQHTSNWCDSWSIRQQGLTHIEPGLRVNSWLSPNTTSNNKNLVDALYQLRDYLLQDAAKLSKYLSTT